MRETELTAECLKGLRAALPAGARVELLQEGAHRGKPPPEGCLEITGPWGRVALPFEAKRHVNDAAVALMDRRYRKADRQRRADAPAWILFAEYVNVEQARRLQEQRIAFADAQGNAHVWGEALYVWVAGNRPKTRRVRTPGLTRPAATRVLFVLLQEPRRVREPYRELATLAGVAPDTVNRVFNDLKQKGFLKTWGARERELMRLPELAELWAMGYEDALRPKLKPKRCHWVVGGTIAEFLDVLPEGLTTARALLGGEAAAAVLTDTIRPTTATLHVPHDVQRAAMETLGLVPREEGPITLLDTFGTTNEWYDGQGAQARLVDPLLIHAELARQDDERARIVAGEIYDEFLLKRFGDAPPLEPAGSSVAAAS